MSTFCAVRFLSSNIVRVSKCDFTIPLRWRSILFVNRFRTRNSTAVRFDSSTIRFGPTTEFTGHTRTCYTAIITSKSPLLSISKRYWFFFFCNRTLCVCLSVSVSVCVSVCPSRCIYIPFCKYPRHHARIPSRNVRNVNRRYACTSNETNRTCVHCNIVYNNNYYCNYIIQLYEHLYSIRFMKTLHAY